MRKVVVWLIKIAIRVLEFDLREWLLEKLRAQLYKTMPRQEQGRYARPARDRYSRGRRS